MIVYAVHAKVLNQAVRPNAERFPVDFMFQLTENEAASLSSQFCALEKTGSQTGNWIFGEELWVMQTT